MEIGGWVVVENKFVNIKKQVIALYVEVRDFDVQGG